MNKVKVFFMMRQPSIEIVKKGCCRKNGNEVCDGSVSKVLAYGVDGVFYEFPFCDKHGNELIKWAPWIEVGEVKEGGVMMGDRSVIETVSLHGLLADVQLLHKEIRVLREEIDWLKKHTKKENTVLCYHCGDSCTPLDMDGDNNWLCQHCNAALIQYNNRLGGMKNGM